jgi:putative methionine-R-sulfoxide reductase with GAF domain
MGALGHAPEQSQSCRAAHVKCRAMAYEIVGSLEVSRWTNQAGTQETARLPNNVLVVRTSLADVRWTLQMKCDVCGQDKTGIAWNSSPRGTLVVCPDCAQDLQLEFQELTARLPECSNLDSLLSEILNTALKITQADMGNVQLLEKGILRIRAQRGFSKEFLEFFSGVEENESACGSALASRQTIVVEDVEQSPIFVGKPSLHVMLNAGARAVQSTPIFSTSDELIGVFSTHYRKPHLISEHEIKLLEYLARRAADFIEHFTLPRAS